jgi:hypothetical protein
MKNLLFILLLCAAGFTSQAQPVKFPYNAGGFGHFYMGPGFFQPGNLASYLEKPDVLNTNITARVGSMAGGEGAGLFGRAIIGGGGFGQNIMRITTDSLRADINYGAGYFRFGYMLKYQNSGFCFAYGGIGWGGLNMTIENHSGENDIDFNHRTPLKPGKKATYTLPTTYYDLGLSYKRIMSSNRSSGGEGGFMLGLDLGCSLITPSFDWQGQDEELVSGPPVPTLFVNPYLRVTIGGGGFGFK